MEAVSDLDALRAKLLRRRDIRQRNSQPPTPTHLHGTSLVCPCGVWMGVATIAFEDGYQAPETCPDCGLHLDDEYRAGHQPGCTHRDD